jgi:MYXO-CTERM domain-containing protein
MMVARRTWQVLTPLAWLFPLAIPALASAGEPDEIQQGGLEPYIWGGEEALPCAWPSVVRVTGGNSLCTGTLIHPKVVMYAAHCGAQNKVIRFGETENTGKTEQVEYCKTYPGYNGSQGVDWAYCVLQREVTEVPFTPVGYGCEVNQYYGNGAQVAVVGFGNNTGDTGAGTKRWGFTTITNATSTRFDVGGNQSTTICSGDSGGPAFIRYADQSWHVYGIASTKNDNTCSSAKGTHAMAANAAQWIEQDSGIDVTVCHDLDGTWNPGPLCGNFFNGQPALSGGSWYTWCQDTTALDWSGACGTDFYTSNVEFNPPQLEIVAPFDGQVFEEEHIMLDITVLAQDDSEWAPVDVQIEIEGMLQTKVVSESPAVFGASFPAGEYTVVAYGVDFWGNTGQSLPVTFMVGPVAGEDEGDGDDDGDDSAGQDAGDGDVPGDDSAGETGQGWFPTTSDETGCACGVESGGSRGGSRGGSLAFGLGLLGLAWLRRRTA